MADPSEQASAVEERSLIEEEVGDIEAMIPRVGSTGTLASVRIGDRVFMQRQPDGTLKVLRIERKGVPL